MSQSAAVSTWRRYTLFPFAFPLPYFLPSVSFLPSTLFLSTFLSHSQSLCFPLPPSFPSSSLLSPLLLSLSLPPYLPHLPVELSLRSNAGDSPTAEHKHTVIHGTLVPRGRWERFGQPLGKAKEAPNIYQVEFQGSTMVGAGGWVCMCACVLCACVSCVHVCCVRMCCVHMCTRVCACRGGQAAGQSSCFCILPRNQYRC